MGKRKKKGGHTRHAPPTRDPAAQASGASVRGIRKESGRGTSEKTRPREAGRDPEDGLPRERTSRARQQAVVIELGQRALAELDIGALMDRAVHAVATTLEADQVGMLELKPGEEETLLLRAGFGWKPGHVGRMTLDTGSGSHGGYTLLEGAPVVFEDLTRESRFNAPYLEAHHVMSGASAVIQSYRRPFGVLGVYSSRCRTFTSDDVWFLEAVANVLGQAIERRRVEEELLHLNETLEHRVEQRTALVKLLRDVAVMANEAETAERAFRSALERICRLMDWPVAHVYWPADENRTSWVSGDTWVIRSARSFERLVEASRTRQFKVGEGLIGRVVGARRPEWIADVTDTPRFLRSRGLEDLGVKSVYAVPVMVRQRVVAVMEFFTEEVTPVSEELLDVIFQLGTQLGRVVEREQSEARYRAVIEDQTDCICRFRPDGTLTFLNVACCRLFGRGRDELLGTDFFSLVPTEGREFLYQQFETFSSERNVQSYEHAFRRRDDSIAWLQWTFRALFTDAGDPFEIQGVGRDVTPQRLMSEQLRQVTARLFSAEEEERKRVARELHDQLNQELAMLQVEAESFSQALPVSDQEVRERLDDFKSRLTRLSEEVHRLAYQLHPSTLDDLGLAAALRSYVEDLAKRHRLIGSVYERNLPDRLPADVAGCLYRVGQEALRNAARHSGTDHVHLRLARLENRIILSVRDFGKGFDTEAGTSGQRRGLGLTSMRERVRLLGGRIAIRSRPGRGTLVRAWVPLEPAVRTV